LSVLPHQTQAWGLGRFVDLIFGQMDGLQKVEETIQPFHKTLHDHDHHEHHNQDVSESEEEAASQPKTSDVSETEKNETLAKLALQAEQWPERFISDDQPFGFSPSPAADFLEIPSAPASSTDVTPSLSRTPSMPLVSTEAKLAAPPPPNMEAKQLALEAKLLGKLSAIRQASNSAIPGNGTIQADADNGQVQRIAALKVAIMGLETYLGSYVSKSSSRLSTPCSTPCAAEKWAGA